MTGTASAPRALPAALTGAVALLLTACGGTSGPETGVSVQDVWENAEELNGQQVTVSAELQRIVGARAFVLGEQDTDPLLVLHDGSAEVDYGPPLQVTGTVRQVLDLEAATRTLDPSTARKVYETYGPEPYLEAISITPLPGE
jgi:hypothetical protein